ncbi:Rep protein [Sporosarcina sp. SG10008]|uniref:rolling circle replication-associated protein n=1 Tax=Sporosarcina sp. SG10008 TaxID=3373103 RepID=UPI0037DD6CE4
MSRNVKYYNTKTIETPTYIEYYEYEYPIFSKKSDEKSSSKLEWLNDDTRNREFDELGTREKYDSLKRKQKHYEAMRWEVARIVDCNFDKATKFVTLTFQDNVTDVEFSNIEFKKFIQRLNRRLAKKSQKANYLATWEKQKRGTIHYHVIFFSLGYIKKSELEKIWSNGFVQINKVDVDSRENRGRYLSKYFSKDLDIKEHKKKAFFKSQNLKTPIVRKTTSSKLHDFSNKNIIYSKKYTQKVLDFKEFDNKNCIFKEGDVQYTKILK